MPKKFFEKLMAGDTSARQITTYIDEWCHTTFLLPLYQYLGMSKLEFMRWVEQDATLEDLEKERRLGKPADMLTVEELVDKLPSLTDPAIREEIKRRLCVA